MVLGVSGSGLKGLMARGVGFKACRVWELAVRESTESSMSYPLLISICKMIKSVFLNQDFVSLASGFVGS